MNSEKFSTEYRRAVDCVSMPENYKENILLSLTEQADTDPRDVNLTESKSKKAYRSALPLIAAVIVAAVGLTAVLSILPKRLSDMKITLSVASATNLHSIAGAKVVFVNSRGELLTDKEGEAVTAFTDEQGVATATIPATEEYTAQISVDGYIPLEEKAQSGNYYISPVMEDDTYRAVLTWEKECDLDAYLSVTTHKGVETLYYFSSDIVGENGEIVAALDVDSETGGTPETVTFNTEENMLCRFSVGSYSALKNGSEAKLSDTGAKVTLYRGEKCVGVYSIDPNADGNVWCVFEVEDDEVSVTDQTYSVSAITEIR